MTREKQIFEYLKERNIPTNSLESNSIMEGIVWADENPKPGMVNKHEFIEKAREWLDNNKDNYIIDIEGETLVDDQIVTDFCKIMEE